jgi:hypothetical protein
MDAVAGTLIGVAIGAAAGVAGTLVTSIVTSRAEERRHLRKIAYETAVKMWTLHCERAEALYKEDKSSGVDPLEAYVFNAMMFAETFGRGRLRKKKALAQWKENDDITKAIHEELRRRNPPPGQHPAR